MRVTFVRHGQSHSNIGLPCNSFADIPLTDLGHQQAAALAARWDRTPTLIVTSPFLRTRQTAAPTLQRFPDVPSESWPIHEFWNLGAHRWVGDPPVKWAEEKRQWSVCDPAYRDGPGTESFADLHDRVHAALDRFAALPPESDVVAFSHGFFMNAVRMAIEQPGLAIDQRMREFVPEHSRRPIQNTETMTIAWDGSRWAIMEEAAS